MTKARSKTVPRLALGPVMFHWPADIWRDFYARIADEAAVDDVFIGETVCAKRAPFTQPLYDEVTQRLERGGKRVFFSTLGEVAVALDRRIVKGVCDMADESRPMVEANDASALFHLEGKPHAVGPLVNVYNEGALRLLAKNGARRLCLGAEIPADSIDIMAQTAQGLGVTLEVTVFGRVSLALSARCYHARAHQRTKDGCLFVCEQDPQGMTLRTLCGQPFLAVNGIQTLSYGCLNLTTEMDELRRYGVGSFRLSPLDCDMIAVADIFRRVMDENIGAGEAVTRLGKITPLPFFNGFYHKRPGHDWIAPEKKVSKKKKKSA